MNWPIAHITSLVLVFAACNPGKPAGDTDDPGTTSTTDPGSTTTTGGFAQLCEDPGGVVAGFSIDIGEWPITGDDVVLDVECEITGPAELTCPDEQDVSRPIQLEWSAEPALNPVWSPGDTVEFHLRRRAADPDQHGAFTVRSRDGLLLLAGNRGNSSHPGDPEFFAPLHLSIDADTCPYEQASSCLELRPLILAVEDGAGTHHLGRGQIVDLGGGHRIQVEHAAMSVSYEDPKFCPVVDAPPVYQFLIAPSPPGA
jgi:hypothetical protein